ncbi:MAG TPA: AAA family ATPase [Longimicrobium sp.]|nr:AAA family ATPase [Longimicrobium sp.]
MQEMPFVGRRAEMARLEAFWADALGGRPRVCLVTGEAGAGKSSLVGAFVARAQAADPGVVVALGKCDAQTGQSDAYLPFLEILELFTGDQQNQAARGPGGSENARRLKDLVRVSLKTLVEHAPDLIGSLVPGGSLAVSAARYAATEVGLLAKVEERLSTRSGGGAVALDQERICHQYTELIKRISAHSPLVLVLDDVHWADSASIDLFFHLTRSLASERVLIVAAYRANDVAIGRGGQRHPLEAPLNELKRYHGDVWVDLERAGPEERRALVDALLDTEPNRLGEPFRAALLRHTGGHPLFVVELLRTLQERGGLAHDAEGRWTVADDLDWGVLPTRVEGVIEERIGRLEGDVREILTVASVEGASFTTEVVARLREMRERELLKVLSGELEKRHRLVVEGATEKVGARWVAQYNFSNVLFQQYLYNDLSGRERMLLHGEVAELLEELYAADPARVAVQLARHYDLAGEPEKAIAHLLVAADRALGVSAYVEARAQLDRGRALLSELRPGPDTARAELQVLTRLCNVINAVEGWDSPALVELYRRSRELCQQLDEKSRLSRVLFGLWTYHLVKMDLEQALGLARDFFTLADELAERDVILQAHAVMANTLFWLGDVAQADEYAQAALDLYHPEIHDAHLALYGQDARMIPLMFRGMCGALLGRPARALEHARAALDAAGGLAHPFSLAFALQTAAAVCHLLRDAAGARAHAEALIDLCAQHGFPFYGGLGATCRGWAAAVQGAPAEGVEQVREGFRAWAGFGGRINHSVYVMMLAEAQLADGDPAGALATLEMGLEVAHGARELACVAELERMRGAALAALGRGGEAGAAFRAALERARGQGLPLFELRAAVSLARHDPGARALEDVAGALERVEGGPAFADVAEAHALLAAHPAAPAPGAGAAPLAVHPQLAEALP